MYTPPLAFRRTLRKNATEPEKLFWRLLRNRALLGHKFRRQHPVGSYVLDFYCPSARLAVELDGGLHFGAEGMRHDARRDAYLAGLGIRVMRFSNVDVFENLEGILEALTLALSHEDVGEGKKALTLALSHEDVGEGKKALTLALSYEDVGEGSEGSPRLSLPGRGRRAKRDG